jgi:PAS domain S-box-containing protein
VHIESFYGTIFDNFPCHISVQDGEFHVIAQNSMARADFGEGVGDFCYRVIKGRDQRCEACPVEMTLLDGQNHCSEELVRWKNGREAWVLVHTAPIRDESGAIVAVQEAFTDITQAKQLQQKYRALFNEAPCYTSVQSRDLRILEANRNSQQDFGSGIGQHCYEVYKHRSEPCVVCPVAETFQDGRIHQSEEVVTTRDGRQVNVLVATAPIRDASGNVQSVMEMSANITVVRDLESQLTSLGLLVGSVSHGIKGLLNGLEGGMYMLDTGLKKENSARVAQGLEMVRRNMERMRSMVLNILYYVKDREVQWEGLDTAEMAESVTSVLAQNAQLLGIDLKAEVQTGGFWGDRNAVHSMLLNLLENSLDACRLDKSKTSHRVTLRAYAQEGSAVFEIEDNGTGMDRETCEKAFSLFFSSKGREGTGLGLFIANKISKSHGGTISIDSVQGHGTKFTVTLPGNRSGS